MRAVILDFHKTLVTAGSLPAWVEQASARAGAHPSAEVVDTLRQVWSRAAQRYPGAEWDLDPTLHRAAFVEILSDVCPRPLADALYDAMPHQWQPVPGAVDLLTGLQAAGMRVGLLSNTALQLRPRLEDMGLLALLDDVVLSFEVGLVKPDPAVFALAAHRLGVDPHECVFVGDTPSADGGAVDAGMTCVLVPVADDVPRLTAASRLLLGR